MPPPEIKREEFHLYIHIDPISFSPSESVTKELVEINKTLHILVDRDEAGLKAAGKKLAAKTDALESALKDQK